MIIDIWSDYAYCTMNIRQNMIIHVYKTIYDYSCTHVYKTIYFE